MNNIIIKYLLNGYLKTFLKVALIFYCFGIMLNLFEEIEFFKNTDTSIFTPLYLTTLYIPGLLIQLLPFIIFVTSMKYIVDIRNNKNLLSLKVFGFSNFKIFMTFSLTSFFLGWLILFFLNPITSVMSKYYEQTKGQYTRDIDHLATFNKNGLWIKENLSNGQRIISASNAGVNKLKNLIIFNFDENYNLKEKIFSKTADIKGNNWILKEVSILEIKDSGSIQKQLDEIIINSIYDYEKITSLFKNFDTLSFLDLIINYDKFIKDGYNKIFLNSSLHAMLSMPFFLFMMTGLASILVLNRLKKTNNVKLIIIGIVVCVIIFYLKDLSLALGKTNRISLVLATWMPILIIGIFSSIGILQINEK
jgi:lipopolysaccharide export system permease protein